MSTRFRPLIKGRAAGLARVATLRKQIMEESPNTLFLLGGDTIAPSVASNIFKGQQMIAVWNMIGLDFAVLGNHEFDFGPEILRERIKESRFTWLATNVMDKKTGKPFADTPPLRHTRDRRRQARLLRVCSRRRRRSFRASART